MSSIRGPLDHCAPDDAAPTTLLEILRRRATQHPDKRAYTFLIDGESREASLSYGELDLLAQTIGQWLIGEGLYGEPVLLVYPPGLDFIAGFFGCLYADLIAVPAYPPDPARLKRTVERLESIAVDCGAKAALTTSSVLSSIDQILGISPILRTIRWLASDTPGEISVDGSIGTATGDSIAFLQYTSGSTGNPKGVMLSHANLMDNASVVGALCEHDSRDKYVSWLPAFHDMGFMAGVLQPLFSGIEAVLMSPGAFLESPLRWLQAISRYRATTSGGPNFAYDLCIRKINADQRLRLDLSSWTVAFNGAEPVRGETLERFARTFGPCGFRKEALYPCYGLAEATLMVTGHRKGVAPAIVSFRKSALAEGRGILNSSADMESRLLVSCGRPVKAEQLVIVDPESAARCPAGQVGEIWVSGPSVGLGYWKKPVETENTFHAYPCDSANGPFLRTGDLGFIQDGELFVTGRLKDLLIIRGVNHYPQDVELTVENSHDALRRGCGAAFSVESGSEERLVVVQELDDRNQNADVAEITGCIRRTVAEQHELQVFAVVLVRPGTVPKTSSGKIQRNACRRVFLEGHLDEVHRSLVEERDGAPSREESFARTALLAIEPTSRLPVAESLVVDQVSRVLRQSPREIPRSQPLSTLGLDSLTALELKNALETQLQIPVSMSSLLRAGTVSEIAIQLLDSLDMPKRTSNEWRAPELSRDDYPLSFMQKAMWFLYQLDPKSAAYNTAFAVRIGSHIEAAALDRALAELVNRHASLRTTFGVREGGPVQQVHPGVTNHIRRVSATGWDKGELDRGITEEAHRPFDLEQGPVYRATLFSLAPPDHVLLLVAHHIVIDGWSYWVLLDELIEQYLVEKTGETKPACRSSLQYADYVDWQIKMLGGPEGETLWEYWKQALSGTLPVLDLPTSRPRSMSQTHSGASYGFRLTADLLSGLKRLAAAKETTLYTILLAAFQVLLHRYSGQDTVLVGSPISARGKAEFENIIGCFFNVAVLHANFHPDQSFSDFVNHVRSTVLGALDHQEYPSHLLVERLQPVRDPSRPPLFQATFILQKPQRMRRVAIAFDETPPQQHERGLAVSFHPIERQHARMELELEMIEAEHEIHAWFHYNKDLFDAETIATMAKHFETLLGSAVKNPHQRVVDLPMLTEAELSEILCEHLVLDEDTFKHFAIEDLFFQQVRERPDKVASLCNDGAVTFDGLDSRSNILASLINQLSGR
jgi:acyl-CoA synthetase (AMP-forming)/AMP-acid ligase II/acyl carrier protein